MDEWWLVFVPDPERWGPLPKEGVLGVRDLPAALDAVGLRPGDPVFVRPDFVVDAELLQFTLSPDFRNLERESRRNYAIDIRLLLSWLWRRGVPWQAATIADLRAYKEFRVDSPLNPQRIGGTKWNREAAALTQLYKHRMNARHATTLLRALLVRMSSYPRSPEGSSCPVNRLRNAAGRSSPWDCPCTGRPADSETAP
ncbi:hypothetical protein [Streptomyces tubercidicus]|uniref:hypothetical protein n=1 Tax=Streptomyces tubercidicus TaxID=47759 RepID=UPI002E0FDF19|nr:hypothetical protein OG761_04465 [Streptomyces tubercidicus]